MGRVTSKRPSVSLLVSLVVFQGIINCRTLLEEREDLRHKIIRFNEIGRNISLCSHLWTRGVPEGSGKKERDIDRQKISLKAFKGVLGLDHEESGESDQSIMSEQPDDSVQSTMSKLEPEIQKLKEKFYRKNESESKPPLEPVFLQTKAFIVKMILEGQNYYSRDFATKFAVIRNPNAEGKILKMSGNAISKVFDPVKLSCTESDVMLFSNVESGLQRFSRNVRCLISECFQREVNAYLALIDKLENYSNYVPKLIEYGFLENEDIRGESTTYEKLYDPYTTDDADNAVLSCQPSKTWWCQSGES